jgi:hypothetical protein
MLNRFVPAARRFLRATPLAAVLGLGAASALMSTPALAWHHHGYWGPRVGVYVGPGYYGPSYYYPPPYYYSQPPVVVAPAAPPVYIEQSPPAAIATPAPAQPSMWYYCAGSRSYYPYVKDCPGGWQQVAPRPAP